VEANIEIPNKYDSISLKRKISEDFLFEIKKRIIKKYLHSRNYSEYDFTLFFVFQLSRGIPFKFHFLYSTKSSHWFLCLRSSCSMTQNNGIKSSSMNRKTDPFFSRVKTIIFTNFPSHINFPFRL
jgi:hypothetical protein